MEAKKVAIMVDEMYQVLEVWYPYYRFRESNLQVNFVAAEANRQYNSKEGYPCISEVAAGGAGPETYDCMVVPGGSVSAVVSEESIGARISSKNGVFVNGDLCLGASRVQRGGPRSSHQRPAERFRGGPCRNSGG